MVFLAFAFADDVAVAVLGLGGGIRGQCGAVFGDPVCGEWSLADIDERSGSAGVGGKLSGAGGIRSVANVTADGGIFGVFCCATLVLPAAAWHVVLKRALRVRR